MDEPTGSYAKHVALLTAALWRVQPGLEVVASGRWGRPQYYRRFDHSPCLTGQVKPMFRCPAHSPTSRQQRLARNF